MKILLKVLLFLRRASGIARLCCVLLVSGCISSQEAPFISLEREAYSSMETANRASRRLDFDAAATHFERACTQFAAIDSTRGLILCQIDTAALYLKTNRTQEAEEILRYAIKQAGRFNHMDLRGTARLYLGFLNNAKKDFAAALKDVESGLLDVTDREEIRRGLQYRAEALLELGKPLEALPVAQDAMGSKIPGRDSFGHSLMARSYLQLKMLDEASRSALIAVELDRQDGISDLLAYDYELLALIHEQSGDKTKATEAATRALNINLAINRFEPARRLIRRLLTLHQSGDRDTEEIDRLNRLLKRIERLR